jgi:hypothetical protein
MSLSVTSATGGRSSLTIQEMGCVLLNEVFALLGEQVRYLFDVQW